MTTMNIPAFGLAQSGIPERIAEALTMGVGFPDVVTVEHESYDEWIAVKSEMRLNLSELEGIDDATLKDSVALFFANTAANDLSELFSQGDTDNTEDPFLALMDGLRKLTVWPSAFALSKRTEVEAESVEDGKALAIRVGMYVTTIESD